MNAPNPDALYGENIRKSLIAGEGRKLVGSDMKSAQLSIAAYYSKNWEYFDSIINGSEFLLDSSGEDYKDPVTGNKVYLGESGHCVSARAFGVISDEEWRRACLTQDPALVKHLHTLRGYSKRASFSCLPVDNTYVYSKDLGWVMYGDLHVGMEILAYNPETKLNEFTPIQHIVTFNDKEVIEMSNNEWKFESTPDHRWLGLHRTASNGKHWEVEEFIQTQDIKSEFKIYNSAVRDDSYITNNQLTIDEAKVLGWILGDGHYHWKPITNGRSTSYGRRRGCRAVITQALKKYYREICDLLNRENALAGYYDKDNILSDGTNSIIRTFSVKSQYFRDLWDKAGFSRVPRDDIPKIDFDNFIRKNDNAVLSAFLDAFYLAEGWKDNRGTKHVAQNEGTLLDCIKDICVMLGINYSLTSKGDSPLANKQCYQLRMRKKQYTGSTKLIKKSKGVRKTFCVTTKFSTFVAKQGDIVTITGNCIFGASGKKLASILKVPESEGAAKRQMYLEKVGLGRVIEYLQAYIKKHPRLNGGYIPLPMGYWVFCSMPHKLFNYLDQGTEAVCQKLSVNRFNRWLEKEIKAGNIDAMKVLDVHDEFLVDSHEDCAQEVGAKMCECYKYASDLVFEWHHDHEDLFPNDGAPEFAFNLNGGFAVGDTYLVCH